MTIRQGVEGDVRDWFAGYLDAFTSLARGARTDSEALLAFYGVPLVMLSEERCSALMDRSAVIGAVQTLVAGLRRVDYAGSIVHRLDVRPLNARAAIINGIFSRYDREGGELERLGATYLVAKTDDGWRFTSIVVTPA